MVAAMTEARKRDDEVEEAGGAASVREGEKDTFFLNPIPFPISYVFPFFLI